MSNEILKTIIESGTTIIVTLLTTYGAYIGIKKSKNKKLITHPLFNKIKIEKNTISNYFTIKNKGKELIFKDILAEHLSIIEKNALQLCNKFDNHEIKTEEQLYEESYKILENIISELSTFYINNSKYTNEEQETLGIVMNKYTVWNKDREDEMIARIKEICVSSFYPTLETKCITIFDTFLFITNDIIIDANKTLNALNGDLHGLTFKGVKL